MKKKNMVETVEVEEEIQVPKVEKPKTELKEVETTQEVDRRNYNIIIEETKKEEPAVNMSKIIIKKVEKPEQPKRITYYLKPETIKKIDRYSKMAGMGKSEFVQTLLEEVLNNLEIEK